MLLRERCPFKLGKTAIKKVMKFSAWSFQVGTENNLPNFCQLAWILNDLGYTRMFATVVGWFWLIFRTRLRYPEAEFLDVIGTKILRVFLLAIHTHSHLSNRILLPLPPPPPPSRAKGVWNLCNVNIVYGNLKYENCQDYAQKHQQKLYVHEFGFCTPASWCLNVLWLTKASTF